MSINQWIHSERPREKLLSKGEHSLTDAEILAILLRSGSRQQDAVQLSRALLTKFGGLRQLYEASNEAILSINGIGIAKLTQLRAALELCRRYLYSQINDQLPIQGSIQIRKYLILKMSHYQEEVFAALFLDIKHRVIQFETLFHGTLSETQVYPRVLIKKALQLNAAAIILAHNHPGGNPQPSPADLAITEKIKQLIQPLDIDLLDHFIIGQNETLSMAERGLI